MASSAPYSSSRHIRGVDVRRWLAQLWPHGFVLLTLLLAYVAAWAASSIPLHGRSDLDLFFWPAAEVAAKGHPLLIYSSDYFGAGPYANGPLGLTPLVPVAALANVIGWGGNAVARTALATALFAALSLMMAAVAVRAIARERGEHEWRVGSFAVLLFAPALWISVTDFGHLEQPLELALVLWGVAYVIRRQYLLAGFALGLAILTRTTAILYAIPVACALLGAHRLKATARLVAVTGLTAAVGVAPFLVARSADVIHSLVTYRGAQPIGGGSLWVITIGTPWSGLVQHADMYFVILTTAAISGALAWRKPNVVATTAGMCGLLTIAGACFPMLARTAFPYYYLEPYVFAVVWWLARPGAAANWRIAVPGLITVDAVIGNIASGPSLASLTAVVGVVSSAVMGLVIVLVAGDLALGSDELLSGYQRSDPPKPATTLHTGGSASIVGVASTQAD